MKSIIVVCLLSFSFTSIAASASNLIELGYSSFYSHLRKLDNDELNQLQFAFGFIAEDKTALCPIEQVQILTDKKDIPITVDGRGRFVLPTEKALRLANAKVSVQLQSAEQICDLSVQLEVKPELFKQGITAAQLLGYKSSFDNFFDNMGGLFSFLMPAPKAIALELADVSQEELVDEVSNTAGVAVQNNKVQLSEDQIEKLTGISLDGLRIISIQPVI